jgi:hypothetical protein
MTPVNSPSIFTAERSAAGVPEGVRNGTRKWNLRVSWCLNEQKPSRFRQEPKFGHNAPLLMIPENGSVVQLTVGRVVHTVTCHCYDVAGAPETVSV